MKLLTMILPILSMTMLLACENKPSQGPLDKNEVRSFSRGIPTSFDTQQISDVAGDDRVHDFSPWYSCVEAEVFKGSVYFNAGFYRSKTGGDIYGPWNLWKWDGNKSYRFSETAGPGVGDNAEWIHTTDSHLYFYSLNQNRKAKLFASDGVKVWPLPSTTGNELSDDFKQWGCTTPSSWRPRAVGNLLYYPALNSKNRVKLFVTDGQSVAQISNTAENEDESDDIDFEEVKGGNVLFQARNSLGKKHLYIARGKTVIPVLDGSGNMMGDGFTLLLGHLKGESLYVATGASGQRGLHKLVSDRLMPISGENGASMPLSILSNADCATEFDGKFYFMGKGPGSTEYELYSTNGKNIDPVSVPKKFGTIPNSCELKATSDALFFMRQNLSGKIKWHFLNQNGKVQLLIPNANPISPDVYFSTTTQVAADKFYFTSFATGKNRLYEYDHGNVSDVTGEGVDPFVLPGGGSDFPVIRMKLGKTSSPLIFTIENHGPLAMMGPRTTAFHDGLIYSKGRIFYRGANTLGYQKMFELLPHYE